MRSDNAVPGTQILKRFLLGQLSRDEAEPIERYLEQHPEIASTLAELDKEDTLVGSLCQAAGQPAADPPELAGLMEKLSQLRSAGNDATMGLPNDNNPEGDALAGLSPPQAADEIGRLGGYRVLKMLGAGGMGMVYQAEDVQLQRPVALKVMKPDVAKNPANRERFLREARAAARLKSDHVVTIHQVGEDKQVVFLAMELLEGMALDDWLTKGRNPSLAQAARIGRQIALGLAAAHERGLIHRDIKPGNVWLDSRHQGRVKLLDFGLARGSSDEIHLTQNGAIVGTPAYMAPEQARGEQVDHRVDLFSLGVVFYRLTTGRLPFRGDNTMSVLASLALDAPTPPREVNPDISPRLGALIERLLSKDRERRPATAMAVADELTAIECEQTVSASSQPVDDRTMQVNQAASVREPVRSPARSRSRLGKYVAAAGLLVLLGGVTAAIVVIIRDRDNKEVGRLVVPEGGKVVIEGDTVGAGLPRPVQQEGVPIAAAPLTPLLPGEPLVPSALVQQPAKLPGVRSWTIETRNVWSPTAIVYRPDGKRLAVGSMDGSIRVWEPETGRLVQVLLGPQGVTSLVWSPDGRVLAAGYGFQKQPVCLWDAETGRLLRALEAPIAQGIQVLAWSPDGRTLRAWGWELCLAWETTGKLLSKYPCPGGLPAFSADGKRLAIPGSDLASIRIRDADTGEEVGKLSGIKEGRGIAWSPDGKRLACAATDGVRVWETETGKEIAHYKDFPGYYAGVAWSPDGRSLAVDMAFHYPIVLVEVASAAKPRSIEGSSGTVLPAWSPDGKTIARIPAQVGESVRLFDVAPGGVARTLSECLGGSGFAWSPNGPSLAAYNRNVPTKVYLSSVDNGQIFAVLKDAGVIAAWSPDGKTLATGGVNGTVLLWERNGKHRSTLAGHTPAWLAWSPDGKRLASCARGEKRVLLWDVEKGERLRELGPFDGMAYDVTWSPDGRLVAFQTEDGCWHLWDVQQNKLINDPKKWKLMASGGEQPTLVFAPDSRAALVWSPTATGYRLRDLATDKEGVLLPPSATPAWSPDGQLLAVPLANDDRVELWTGDLSRRVRTLRASLLNVHLVGFSRDGKLLAGSTGDRLHVWETDTGRLRGIQLLDERNNGLTITPDGRYTGNEQVERGIVMVVQKDDGTQEVLEPADFKQKHGFKNEPDEVHLLQPLPPDGERELAEWLLKIGAGVKRIRLGDGAKRVVGKIEQLPDEPFRVLAIVLPITHTRPLTEDAILAHLRKGGAIQDVFIEFPFSKPGVLRLLSSPGLQDVKAFNLRGPKDFDDECLLLAAKFERLERLTVPASKDGAISPGVLEKLRQLPLKELILAASNIGDKHLESIGKYALLEKIDLGVNPITDAGLAHLAELKKLRGLKLFRTRITAEGVKKLAAALPSCEIKWDGGVLEPRK